MFILSCFRSYVCRVGTCRGLSVSTQLVGHIIKLIIIVIFVRYSWSLLLQPGALQVHVDPGVDVRHFYDYSCGNASHQHLGLHGSGLWLVWIVSVSQSLKKIHNFNVELS